jgi:hypothetical protein
MLAGLDRLRRSACRSASARRGSPSSGRIAGEPDPARRLPRSLAAATAAVLAGAHMRSAHYGRWRRSPLCRGLCGVAEGRYAAAQGARSEHVAVTIQSFRLRDAHLTSVLRRRVWYRLSTACFSCVMFQGDAGRPDASWGTGQRSWPARLLRPSRFSSSPPYGTSWGSSTTYLRSFWVLRPDRGSSSRSSDGPVAQFGQDTRFFRAR